MILTMIQTLGKVWKHIYPYIAGITIGGIVSCVFFCLFKFSFTKLLKKVDENKMKNEAVEAAKKEVKETTFKVNIQPIVISEVKKVCEEIKSDVNTKLVKSNEDIDKRLSKLENVVVALGNYFDDSIGVSESKKQAFHQAVEELSTKEETPNIVVVEQLEVNTDTVKEVKEETITIER